MKYLKDESIGMVGPTTNIKGNQTATNIAYNYYEEYLDFSEKVLYDNFYKYNDINELSLFCTMFRKEVVEKVGLIPDEKEETVYNKFEEYDYSIKIKNSGLRLICCKDLYMHVGAGSLREFHQKGQKKVAIIILSYNLLDKTTKPCIESIYRAKTHCDFEVLVVDNLSTDGTRDYLLSAKDEYKNLRLLFNEQNLGFAGGNNAGMKAIQADYYILLNSDTIVTDYWIDKIVDFMETHPEVGMAGPITNSAGNEQMIYVKSTTEEEIIKEGLEWANKHSKDYFFTNLLGFYCVAIRKEILDNVGYLDEAYGIGMFEDDDFSLRVMKAGYKLAVLENVFIYHKGSVSFSSLLTDEFRNKTFFKNLKYYEQKFNIKWKSKFNTDTFVEVIQHYLRNIDDSNADRIKEKIANRLEIMKNFDYAGKNLDNIMLWQQTLPKEQRFIE
jgi:GT2 family glycosyltransferase